MWSFTSFQEYGHKAAFYHGSMDPELRSSVQKQWSKDEINIICATVAFGMGMIQFFWLEHLKQILQNSWGFLLQQLLESVLQKGESTKEMVKFSKFGELIKND